jgi:hypothetical protein
MEQFKPEINEPEQIDKYEVRRAAHDWGRGRLGTALEVYEKWGLDAFRKFLPEANWKIKHEILEVFRAINKEEEENGPVVFGGMDSEKKIQRLTSWTKNKEFAKEWAGKEGRVLKMIADKDDIAFFPLNSPHKNKEKEVVIADYHLKKDKISKLEEDV